MKSKTLILFLIIAVAVFLRLWDLTKMPPGLYPDEAMNGNNASEALETGDFKIFYPENNGREGLFINIQALSVAVFGSKPWALRLVSSLFGILTVIGVFYLTQELFKNNQPQNQKSKIKNQNDNLKFKNLERNEKIALISSYFLATSFWHINFSRIGFRAIMAPFFLTWSLFFLLAALNKIDFFNSIKNEESKIIIQKSKIFLFSIVGGILYGLGLHSYIAYRATPVLVLLVFIYFLFKNKEVRKQIFVSAILFFIATFVAVSPLLLYFYQNPQDFLGRTAQISIFDAESPLSAIIKNTALTLGMFWYRGDYNFRHNFSGEPQLFWPVGILFGLGLVVFFIKIIRNLLFKNYLKIKNLKLKINKENTIFSEILLLFWFLIGLLPVVISDEGIPHALRAIIVLPPIMIISAASSAWLYSSITNWLVKQAGNFPEISKKILRIKKEFGVAVIVFCAVLFAQVYAQYFWRYAARPEIQDAFSQKYAKLGSYLNSLPRNTEKFVIVNAGGTDVRGVPMPSQTVMFMTKTFLPEWQKEKKLRYILPQNLGEISCANSCAIITLENDSSMRAELKKQIPSLQSDSSSGVFVLKNF